MQNSIFKFTKTSRTAAIWLAHPESLPTFAALMKKHRSKAQLPGIICLLLAFLLSASLPCAALPGAACKPVATQKEDGCQKTIAAAKADQAVVPFFSIKLSQQYLITPARQFFIVINEKPRHPDAFPIYLSTYFANIFSKAIAINAP